MKSLFKKTYLNIIFSLIFGIFFLSQSAFAVLFYSHTGSANCSQAVVAWKGDSEIKISPLSWEGGCFYSDIPGFRYEEKEEDFYLALPCTQKASFLRMRGLTKEADSEFKNKYCLLVNGSSHETESDEITIIIPFQPGLDQDLKLRLGGEKVSEDAVSVFINDVEGSTFLSSGKKFIFEQTVSHGVIKVRIVNGRISPDQCFIDNQRSKKSFCFDSDGAGIDAIDGDFILVVPDSICLGSTAFPADIKTNNRGSNKLACEVQVAGIDYSITDISCPFLSEAHSSDETHTGFNLLRSGVEPLLHATFSPLSPLMWLKDYFYADWNDRVGHCVQEDSKFLVFIGHKLNDLNSLQEDWRNSEPSQNLTNHTDGSNGTQRISMTLNSSATLGKHKIYEPIPRTALFRDGTIIRRKNLKEGDAKVRVVINGHAINLDEYSKDFKACLPELGMKLMVPDETLEMRHINGESQLICMVSPEGVIEDISEKTTEALTKCRRRYQDEGYRYIRYNLIQDSYRYKLKIDFNDGCKQSVIFAADSKDKRSELEQQKACLGRHLKAALPSDAWYAVSEFAQQEKYIDFVLTINQKVLPLLCPDNPFQVCTGRVGSMSVLELADGGYLVKTSAKYNEVTIAQNGRQELKLLSATEYTTSRGEFKVGAKFDFETECFIKKQGDDYVLGAFRYTLEGWSSALGKLESTLAPVTFEEDQKGRGKRKLVSGPIGGLTRATELKSRDLLKLSVRSAEIAIKEYYGISVEKDRFPLSEWNPYWRDYMLDQRFHNANVLMAELLLGLHLYSSNGQVCENPLLFPQVFPKVNFVSGGFNYDDCRTRARLICSRIPKDEKDPFFVPAKPKAGRCCPALESLRDISLPAAFFTNEKLEHVINWVVKSAVKERKVNLKDFVIVSKRCVLYCIDTPDAAKRLAKKVTSSFPGDGIKDFMSKVSPNMKKQAKSDRAYIESYLEAVLNKLFKVGGMDEVDLDTAINKTCSVLMSALQDTGCVASSRRTEVLYVILFEFGGAGRSDLVAAEEDQPTRRATLGELLQKPLIHVEQVGHDRSSHQRSLSADWSSVHSVECHMNPGLGRSVSHEPSSKLNVSDRSLLGVDQNDAEYTSPSPASSSNTHLSSGEDIDLDGSGRTQVERARKKSFADDLLRIGKYLYARFTSGQKKAPVIAGSKRLKGQKYGAVSCSDITSHKVTSHIDIDIEDEDRRGEALLLEEREETLTRRRSEGNLLDQIEVEEAEEWTVSPLHTGANSSPVGGSKQGSRKLSLDRSVSHSTQFLRPPNAAGFDSGIFISYDTRSSNSSFYSGSHSDSHSRLYRDLMSPPSGGSGSVSHLHWPPTKGNYHIPSTPTGLVIHHSKANSFDSSHGKVASAHRKTSYGPPSRTCSDPGDVLTGASLNKSTVHSRKLSVEPRLAVVPATPNYVVPDKWEQELGAVAQPKQFTFSQVSPSAVEVRKYLWEVRNGASHPDCLVEVFKDIIETYFGGSVYALADKFRSYIDSEKYFQASADKLNPQVVEQLLRELMERTSSADDNQLTTILNGITPQIIEIFRRYLKLHNTVTTEC